MTRISKLLSSLFICMAFALAQGADQGMVKDGDKKSEKISEKKPVSKKADSLKTLEVMISTELKSGNRVLRICKAEWSDSLMRCDWTRKDQFEGWAGDTALAREIKSQAEFRKYWSQVEKENGVTALKHQLDRHDIDKTLIPKLYFLDSSVVVFPGWLIFRKK